MNIDLPTGKDKAALCTALDLAMAELAKQRPFRGDKAELRENVMKDILEQAGVGNDDPEKLATHAIERCGRHP